MVAIKRSALFNKGIHLVSVAMLVLSLLLSPTVVPIAESPDQWAFYTPGVLWDYNGQDEELIVPSVLGDVPVTTVDLFAYEGESYDPVHCIRLGNSYREKAVCSRFYCFKGYLRGPAVCREYRSSL